MVPNSYEITEPTTGFKEGEILDVTARFGDWHTHDLKLEARPRAYGSKTVLVTETPAGFSEAEILDETARLGDWHEYDLQFDPVTTSTDGEATSGQVSITMDELHSIAEPVDTSA